MSPSRKRRLTLCTVVAITGALLERSASAQSSAAVERFQPAPAGDALFGVQGPAVGGHLVPRANVVFDYAHKPLSIEQNGTRSTIVSSQLFLHLNASLALWDRLLVSLDVPFALAQSGDSPTVAGSKFTSPSGAEIGDLRFGARGRLYGDYWDPFQLAIGAYLWAPTAPGASYAGDGAVRFAPQLVAGGRFTHFVYSASLGTTLHASDHPHVLDIDLGAAVVLGDGLVQIGPELRIATPFEKDKSFSTSKSNVELATSTAAELFFGAKLRPFGPLVFGLGGGPGLTNGFGTPVFFAVGSIGYEPLPPRERRQEPEAEGADRDGDGIPDADDACPDTRGKRNDDPKKNGCRPGDDDVVIPPSQPGPTPPAAENLEPLDKLDRAARVECASSGSSSNVSCALANKTAGCKAGDAEDCDVAGRVSMSQDVHDVPKGSVAPFILMRACKLAPAKCSSFVPIAMRTGDPKLARTFLEEGCSRSVAVCKEAATMYTRGQAVEASPSTAREFAKRACAGGDAASCK